MALYGWAHMAAEHWMKYRPKMYRELVSKGLLESRANKAVDLTKDAVLEGVHDGMSWDQIWEANRERWMFLPTEEDVPNLGEDPNRPPDPATLTESTAPRKPQR